MNKKIKGFTLIREYPNSKKVGSFEPYTTGEFLKYPHLWKPVYIGSAVVKTETHTIEITVSPL